MSIVTRKGDRGITSLYGGTKVAKDDIRVETCGALDEVSSFLGMAKSLAKDRKTMSVLELIQKELMVLASEIAAAPAAADRLKKKITGSSVFIIEKEIDSLENKCDINIRAFSLPGYNTVSNSMDIARAITRRAERRCVTMMKKKMLKNRNIVVYLNRLSDLLYLLARYHAKKK